MDKETGGPAFPSMNWETTGDGKVAHYQTDGMALRDYFAAKAMQAMIADDWHGRIELTAREAYQIADAMLEARK